MSQTVLQRFPFLLPLATILVSVLTVHTALFHEEPDLLSLTIAADLLITSPVLYYILIRSSKIPKISVLSVFVAGAIVANFILPLEQQFVLTYVKKFALPLAEVGLLVWLLVQIRNIRKVYIDQVQLDFFSAIKMACVGVFPARLAAVLSTEIAVVYYNFFCWHKRLLQANEYSHHKRSGTALIVGTFIGVLLVETFAAHLLLERWNTTVAWIATALSIYTVFQLMALLRSIPQRPIYIDQKARNLVLRYGFFSETVLPITDIDHIEASSRSIPDQAQDIIPLSPLGSLTSHNVIIHLTNHAHLSSLYGGQKTYLGIAFWVDDRAAFIKQLESITPAAQLS